MTDQPTPQFPSAWGMTDQPTPQTENPYKGEEWVEGAWREGYEAGLAQARTEGLDVEVLATEEVMPKGWRFSISPYYPSGYEAEAHDITREWQPGRGKYGTGTTGPYPTVTEALAALRAILAARRVR